MRATHRTTYLKIKTHFISDDLKMLINLDNWNGVSSYLECGSPAKWLYKGSMERTEVYKCVRCKVEI